MPRPAWRATSSSSRTARAASRGGRPPRRGAAALRGTLVAAVAAAGLGAAAWSATAAGSPASWRLPNRDLASTRAAVDSPIRAATVARLRVRWRYTLRGGVARDGALSATPLVVGDRVYVQDMESNVLALALADGRLLWRRHFGASSPGPNGIAEAGGRLFGATDTTAFALDASTGRVVWTRRLVSATEQYVDVAPIVARGLVYIATVGYPPGGRGALYALDERTGAVRWRFDTIRDPWRRPRLAGGGGAWEPMSLGGDGRLYAGVANPDPWGGSPRLPNGGAFRGPALYSSSLVVLDGRSGRLLWHDQVTPHDVRDYDFQASPLLVRAGGRDLVIGAGKAGRVIAWNRSSGRRVWATAVGLHANDTGPLPRTPVRVCPGLLGGVETPMAAAKGRVFVPVVDLCYRESAVRSASVTQVDPATGRGELVALDASSGRRLWRARFSSPDFGCATVAGDLVFTALLDGRVLALRAGDGKAVWSARVRAGVDACPAVAGRTLVVAAGARSGAISRPVDEVVAYGLAG